MDPKKRNPEAVAAASGFRSIEGYGHACDFSEDTSSFVQSPAAGRPVRRLSTGKRRAQLPAAFPRIGERSAS